jgi:hypothetical protein
MAVYAPRLLGYYILRNVRYTPCGGNLEGQDQKSHNYGPDDMDKYDHLMAPYKRMIAMDETNKQGN